MTRQCQNFMEPVEAKIVNAQESLFGGTKPDRVYYSVFGGIYDAGENVLPYGEEIQDQKEVDVNEAYIEALDNYIGDKLVFPDKYSIPVIAWVKHRNSDDSCNPIGE